MGTWWEAVHDYLRHLQQSPLRAAERIKSAPVNAAEADALEHRPRALRTYLERLDTR